MNLNMNVKVFGIAALFAASVLAVVTYPSIRSHATPDPLPVPGQTGRAQIEVVFVLDTTGSMAGLIDAAKDKIWSIATSMAQANPTPEISIGLVAYRDRGDAYVTQVVDLTRDLDSMYARLMDFQAGGGGDLPESVNQALYDAIHNVSWSRNPDSYKVVFLVGDAPPHMDYPDDVRYPQILAAAAAKGIVVNTIQCGDLPDTARYWQHIAALGQGRYFQVEQGGSAVVIDTPVDAQIAILSAEIDRTRLHYGSPEQRAEMVLKFAAADKVHAEASPAARARRAMFNASAAGAANLLGERELVDDVVSGRVELAELPEEQLPASLLGRSPEEQTALIEETARQRAELQSRVRELVAERDTFIAEAMKERGDAAQSLDHQIYDAVRVQAAEKGLAYQDGPKY